MNCCNVKKENRKKRGFLAGILYGLTPHTFCILFVVFTFLGATTATTLLKPLLLNPYFFYFLIALSLIFATTSVIIYLRKNGILSLQGIKRKWKYLSILYGTTIVINLFLFMIVFPIATNVSSGSSLTSSIIGAFGDGEKIQLSESGQLLTLQVNIPCPGHAPLITGELRKISGAENVRFRFPNLFDVSYNPEKTSTEQIISLDVFNVYKATVVSVES